MFGRLRIPLFGKNKIGDFFQVHGLQGLGALRTDAWHETHVNAPQSVFVNPVSRLRD